MVDVDAVTTELYGLLPEEFTAARDARAAAARRDGDRAAAEALAALRRPTLAVWAANLLARAEEDQARRLLELGQGLREAHRNLAGEALRTLSHQQHVVVAAMAREACRLAGEAGKPVSGSVRHAVEQILRAVLADPATAETWARGALAEAPPPVVGFAETAPAPGALPRPAKRRTAGAPEVEPPDPEATDPESQTPKTSAAKGRDRKARDAKAKDTKAKDTKAKDTKARDAKARERARAEADRARAAAERADEELARAEAERSRAHEALAAADAELAGLRARLDRAGDERDRLAAAAEDADRRRRQADGEARTARTAATAAQRAVADENPSGG
ncbi:hypothetical protein ACIA6E_21550 [Streptomyces sp. NPDC051815]|uniref:hypothetical protein n=1 Tax=Streptomyces sp. NPDC051815 TaxID=3365674 RepID=UPI00379145CA